MKIETQSSGQNVLKTLTEKDTASPPSELQRQQQPQLQPELQESMKKVARQFESLFVNQLVSAMRKTIQKGELIPESQAERVYQGMLDTEYSQKMAETDQLGMAKLVYEHLLRTSGGQ